jgi:hypothetical protein
MMEQAPQPYCGLTLLPPSPVSEKVPVSVRVGVVAGAGDAIPARVDLYLDAEGERRFLASWTPPEDAGLSMLFEYKLDTRGMGGHHRITAVLSFAGAPPCRCEKPLQVVESRHRSTGRIDGAFVGFYHWSEQEGRLWNAELARMTDADWRDMMRAQHEIGMDIVVPQEAFRNQLYVGEHAIPQRGYDGRGFYPSHLHPGRMEIACGDPMEAVLGAADELGMAVFLPVGMYAWFDFTEHSLAWHREVARELWQRYGHHRSVYGFYVSEEVGGDLGSCAARREEVVSFFAGFRAFVRGFAPDKPVMLATNCHSVSTALPWYPRLLSSLDILCPFGFQRMPPDDLTGEEAAALLQSLCDHAGCRLWMDLEAFSFHPDGALYPRPMADLVDAFRRYPMFEKVVCYQFPGLFSAPWARIQPGGRDTVRLFEEYSAYLRSPQSGETYLAVAPEAAGQRQPA